MGYYEPFELALNKMYDLINSQKKRTTATFINGKIDKKVKAKMLTIAKLINKEVDKENTL